MDTMWASNLKMTITNNNITQMCLFLVKIFRINFGGLKNVRRKH